MMLSLWLAFLQLLKLLSSAIQLMAQGFCFMNLLLWFYHETKPNWGDLEYLELVVCCFITLTNLGGVLWLMLDVCVQSVQGAHNLQTVQGLQSVTLQNGQLILTGTPVGGAQLQQVQQQQAATSSVVITLPSVNQTTPNKSGKVLAWSC